MYRGGRIVNSRSVEALSTESHTRQRGIFDHLNVIGSLGIWHVVSLLPQPVSSIDPRPNAFSPILSISKDRLAEQEAINRVNCKRS
ncbi:hypothetical protein Salmuc_03279 [Salipiger mucosus DSM 16094]|uniref:Uncharacterized protein n=1 Tax=Salipiger mucosus DSM 16094 TaxID=1123237 RepID=S9QDF5_9RHOB|nr:hypothetical protein Salmuc_03279 [Salipiger mucosus DSM 16094]